MLSNKVVFLAQRYPKFKRKSLRWNNFLRARRGERERGEVLFFSFFSFFLYFLEIGLSICKGSRREEERVLVTVGGLLKGEHLDRRLPAERADPLRAVSQDP